MQRFCEADLRAFVRSFPLFFTTMIFSLVLSFQYHRARRCVSNTFSHSDITRCTRGDGVKIIGGDIFFFNKNTADSGAGHTGFQIRSQIFRCHAANSQQRNVVDWGADRLDIMQIDAVSRKKFHEVGARLLRSDDFGGRKRAGNGEKPRRLCCADDLHIHVRRNNILRSGRSRQLPL